MPHEYDRSVGPRCCGVAFHGTVPLAAAQERSLDEIKKEVMRRAGHINPFEGIRWEDATQVVASLNALIIDMPGTGETQVATPERR